PKTLGLALERAIARLREPAGVGVLVAQLREAIESEPEDCFGVSMKAGRAYGVRDNLLCIVGLIEQAIAPQPPAEAQAQGSGEVVESGWYYTDTGQHVQVWRITQDDGCWCSDMKYHCATTLYAAPPSAPVGG